MSWNIHEILMERKLRESIQNLKIECYQIWELQKLIYNELSLVG